MSELGRQKPHIQVSKVFKTGRNRWFCIYKNDITHGYTALEALKKMKRWH